MLGHRRQRIAEKVRALRKTRGWTQTELSARLGLSQARLSEIESGSGSFSAEQFLEILKLFNVGIDHFANETREPATELQNTLARLGAHQLQEREDVLPRKDLEDVATVLYEALVSGTPRIITALAPVLVLHIDELNLNAVRAKLAPVGLQRRLDWLIDNTAHAIQEELRRSPPRTRAQRYRRAELVLETALDFAKQRLPSPESPPDILDGHIRTKATLQDVVASSSTISRRWRIATALQPQDFIDALRAAFANRVGCDHRQARTLQRERSERHRRDGRSKVRCPRRNRLVLP
jgi:transcriptional regulator with XRE-family HTH domain